MRIKSTRIPLVILFLALVGLYPWQKVEANNYEVTNTNDSGPGSLRQAITNANNNSAADIITFADATNGTPITLTGAAGDEANASGDLDILDGGNLTIQGNGSANTIIDGGGIDRVFHVCPGGGCSNSVSIQGLTIQNGDSSDFGGGLRHEAGTLTVDESTVKANSAAFYGGGIFNEATLIVQNGSLIGGVGNGNQAMINGGGLFNATGTMTVTHSTVSANTADNNGGGIWNNATLTVLNNCIIGGSVANAGNQAIHGGGIYNYQDGTTTVDGSTVSDNSGSLGGGIYNRATLTVQNDSMIGGIGAGNQASDGGGIFNYAGTTTVNGSTISANTASVTGGGISNRARLYIQNNSIIGGAGAGNTAEAFGGGIYNLDSNVFIVNSIVSANHAAYGGGGIDNDRGLLNISNSTIGGAGAGNTALYGAGISLDEGVTLIYGSSTVSHNHADDAGGGIFLEEGYSYTTVQNSRVLNNSAATNGGGVYINSDIEEVISVTDSCINGNSTISFYNNQSAQQIATGNWWGGATGPNTPGADTYHGNVDVSGYLTTPILDCSPDLEVGKANDTGDEGTVGTPFHWILTVTNTGLLDAVLSDGQTILVDDLYPGPTYGSPIVGSFVDVTNSGNIDCSLDGNTITCTADSGSVVLGAVTGSFQVSISVTPNAPATLVNPAGICRVDPNGVVTESDETNNNCPANVVNVTNQTRYIHLPIILRVFP